MSNSPESPTPNLGNRPTLCKNVDITRFIFHCSFYICLLSLPATAGQAAMTNDNGKMNNEKCVCLLSSKGRHPILVNHPDRDLRQLPHLVPLDIVILAVDQLLNQQVAELTALAFEHELFGVRLGDVE